MRGLQTLGRSLGRGLLDDRAGSLRYQQMVKAAASWLQYLQLGEASGPTMADSSGSGRDGTGTTINLGQPGMGDGQTAITITDSGGVNLYSDSLRDVFNPNAFTLNLWWKSPGSWLIVDGTLHYFVNLAADANNAVEFKKTADGFLTFNYRAGGVDKTITIFYMYEVPWLDFVLTGNKAGDKLILYCNGTQYKPAVTGLGNWAGQLASTTTMLGAKDTSFTNPGRGSFQHWAVDDAVMDPATVWQLSRSRGQFIFDGDSRMDNTLVPWKAFVQSGRTDFGIGNYAVSGRDVAGMITLAPTNIDPLYKDVPNVLDIWGGVNDGIGQPSETIYGRIKTYCLARRTAALAAGKTLKINVNTEIDAQDASRNANNWHTNYLQLNAFLRAGCADFADSLTDLGAIPQLQDALGDAFNPDHVHPDDSGMALIGNAKALQLAALANGTTPPATDLATVRRAGARTPGETFTHPADCLIAFTLTTRQSAGFVNVDFRKQDAQNFWRLLIDAAGAINLYEFIGGTPNQRKVSTGVVSGDVIWILMQGSTIKMLRNGGIKAGAYTTATNFQTATSGVISNIDSDGVVSNLIVWPLAVSV